MLEFEIDAAEGARIASLRVDGRELLWVDRRGGPMQWGAYPMVPFAGRIRGGRFRFAGRDYHLPANLGPHAIHGTGFTARWEAEPDGGFVHELPAPWPFGGWARHRVVADDDGTVRATLEVGNDERSMPAQAGWHPWFARPVELAFTAGAMWRRDGDGICDGTLVRPPPPGPWDDCFTEVDQPMVLTWPVGPRLALTSSCRHWVVYDEPAHALCAEPQSGPPDGFTLAPEVVEPGRPLQAWFTLAVVAPPTPRPTPAA